MSALLRFKGSKAAVISSNAAVISPTAETISNGGDILALDSKNHIKRGHRQHLQRTAKRFFLEQWLNGGTSS